MRAAKVKKAKSPVKGRRKKLVFAAVAVISILFVIYLIFHMYNANLNFSRPLNLDDYTSDSCPWSYYMIENGEKVELKAEDSEDGAAIKSFRPVYCEMQLEYVIKNAVLDFGRLNGPAVAFLDDNPVFANSDYNIGENGVEFCGDMRLSADDTIVTLPDKYDGKTLQVVFMPSDGKVVLPEIKLANVKTIFGEQSVNVLDGIVRAVCSLLFTMIALCIFIVERYKGKTDIAILLLVIYFSLNVLVPINLDYSNISDTTATILNNYRIGEFLLAFATAIMLLYFTLKAQNNAKATVFIAIAYSALLLISYGVACILGPNAVAQIISFSYILFYLQLLFMFAISFAEWRGGSFFFKYYSIFAAVGVVAAIMWSLYSYGPSTIAQGDIIGFLELTKRSFLQPYLSSCTIIIVTVEFIVNIIHNETTIHALTMQNQLTQEYINNLEDTIVAVRKTRHEMRHHIEAISIMAENKYYDKLEDYLNNLSKIEKDSAPLYYSKNKIVSAVISSKLRDAKAKSIETEVAVNLPEHLPLNSMLFSSFLMNVLENAVEACDRLPQGKRRWIKLKITIKNGKLIVGCANSSNEQSKKSGERFLTTKEDAELHGFGISIMQQCCESVGGSMVIEEQSGSFAVRAVFPLEQKSEENE